MYAIDGGMIFRRSWRRAHLSAPARRISTWPFNQSIWSNDKIGYEHETWLTTTAVEALQTARRSQAVISEWVFPAPSDPAKPISRHVVRNWWGRGQELASLPAEPGRGWHSLGRQFATEMKHAPLKDLCALGGWKSPQTVLTCYQRADSASMQQALAARRRPEG
jgi:integrase